MYVMSTSYDHVLTQVFHRTWWTLMTNCTHFKHADLTTGGKKCKLYIRVRYAVCSGYLVNGYFFVSVLPCCPSTCTKWIVIQRDTVSDAKINTSDWNDAQFLTLAAWFGLLSGNCAPNLPGGGRVGRLQYTGVIEHFGGGRFASNKRSTLCNVEKGSRR